MRLGPRGQLGCGVLIIMLSGFGMVMWFSGETGFPFEDAPAFVNLLMLVVILAMGCGLVWMYIDSARRRQVAGELSEAARRKLEGMMARPRGASNTDRPPTSPRDRDAGEPK
jgi:hypothetical protein